jgi:hypothetical protein
MFKKGDKVICINVDALDTGTSNIHNYLTKGKNYTVGANQIDDHILIEFDDHNISNFFRHERFQLAAIKVVINENDNAQQVALKVSAALDNKHICTCDLHTVVMRYGCQCGGI